MPSRNSCDLCLAASTSPVTAPHSMSTRRNSNASSWADASFEIVHGRGGRQPAGGVGVRAIRSTPHETFRPPAARGSGQGHPRGASAPAPWRGGWRRPGSHASSRPGHLPTAPSIGRVRVRRRAVSALVLVAPSAASSQSDDLEHTITRSLHLSQCPVVWN